MVDDLGDVRTGIADGHRGYKPGSGMAALAAFVMCAFACLRWFGFEESAERWMHDKKVPEP